MNAIVGGLGWLAMLLAAAWIAEMGCRALGVG
jgi:hypothetical protein